MVGRRRVARVRRGRVALSAALAGAVTIAVAACSSGVRTMQSAAVAAVSAPAGPHAPTAPPVRVCGNKADLTGPATPPKGAVRVPAGSNASVDFGRPDTTYWFAPGVHTLGTGEYDNINPASGDSYLGAPGAILDGQHKNDSAFDGTAQHVLIEFLTVRNFGTWGGDQQEGVVNHDSGAYWTIAHSTISGNAGAGVMLGTRDRLSWNCVQGNQQYGFNAYSNSGTITNIVLDHNEIAGNDTYDYEARQPGCGCSGGGKFWNVIDAAVTDNWVNDNKGVGLWADTDNAGFEFTGNYISGSQGPGLMYEISYNAVIEYNTFNEDGVTGGPASTGFPTSAVYISESGSDSRVSSNYKTQPLLIARNIFVNNWSGVILWENSNRFCASPDNSSTGYCTMADPKATLTTCGDAATIKTQPYLADCRWKTQNALVEFNKFALTPSAIGKACTAARDCGYNGVFSEYGSDPSWSPYQGDLVPTDIAFHQGNRFYGNTYSGPWCFMGWELGTSVSFKQWQAAASVGKHQFGQDTNSVHTGATWSCPA